jgi:hypothetical protein
LPRSTLHRGAVAGLLGAWRLAITVGMILVGAYTARPGDAGAVPARWPAGGTVRLDGRRPTLLIFLHPRCPCSRASLDELGRIKGERGDGRQPQGDLPDSTSAPPRSLAARGPGRIDRLACSSPGTAPQASAMPPPSGGSEDLSGSPLRPGMSDADGPCGGA